MAGQAKPIRVVVFTGGPELEPQLVKFLERLEQDPSIALVAIFSESPHRGASGVVRDLWARRGVLALPLLMLRVAHHFWRETVTRGVSQRRRNLLVQLQSRIYFVADIHDPGVIEHVRDLKPELGLVYGGAILKPELFGAPDRGTLGIHHGKVPEYRGKKTTFWAMYNGEPEVGVTIQQIGSRLDGGEVLLEGRVPVGRQPLPCVKRRLEKLGLDLYLQAVHSVREGSAVYLAQPMQSATLYRDPGAVDIVRFWIRYLLRLIRIP